MLVVIGRSWNKYNLGEMPDLASYSVPATRVEMFERDRNLSYVAYYSRPKKRLTLLFTQQFSAAAMWKVQGWVGNSFVEGGAVCA